MRIIILSTAFSGIAQRLLGELLLLGHDIEQHYSLDEERLRYQVKTFEPDLILCPYLTQRIPEDVWQKVLCLIVHPGVEGDRGSSSLDWAISEGLSEWGVTLIKADKEFDAGEVWGTENFPLRQASKTSVYKREVVEAAMRLIKRVLANLALDMHFPHQTNDTQANINGRFRPSMKKEDRKINWHCSSRDVINKINAADSRPGAFATMENIEVRLFGASPEFNLRGSPGKILARHHGAICIGTLDGAVWIKIMQCLGHKDVAPIKLPASLVLDKIFSRRFIRNLNLKYDSGPMREIRVLNDNNIAKIYFDFYNGAMSTEQCLELKVTLQKVKKSSAKVIVLMGGEDFFSNGIHLNMIEASARPGHEAWRNINAMNDLVYEIFNTPNQLTVAALRSNAGAGGAIMALACDSVMIRDGVVLNPHYQTMGLYGSEYWTYLLPNRVGEAAATEITQSCQPIIAKQAYAIGFADALLPECWHLFHSELDRHCESMLYRGGYEQDLEAKNIRLKDLKKAKTLEKCRKQELKIMKQLFYDKDSAFHKLRKAFVYKQKNKLSAKTIDTNFDQQATG